MRIIRIQQRPFTVINGKDFAVYRWFEPERHGPLFLQVAGRTTLQREDLPTDDWVVIPGRAGSHRIATAWRKPWFEYKPDATRKLAFLGGSTDGSLYLALRYIVRRFGLAAEETAIAGRSSALLANDPPLPSYLQRSTDLGLSGSDLVTLDLPSPFDRDDAASLLDVA
ncbi:MAG TPA: hypothetical protein VF701_02075 [Thermoanaerobaculia bacterium]